MRINGSNRMAIYNRLVFRRHKKRAEIKDLRSYSVDGNTTVHRLGYSGFNYVVFTELLTLVKVPDKFVPRLVIAVIAATAIKAAIRPYSIAVAPSSFLKIFLKDFMVGLQFICSFTLAA